jgi:hypothetical protein
LQDNGIDCKDRGGRFPAALEGSHGESQFEGVEKIPF